MKTWGVVGGLAIGLVIAIGMVAAQAQPRERWEVRYQPGVGKIKKFVGILEFKGQTLDFMPTNGFKILGYTGDAAQGVIDFTQGFGVLVINRKPIGKPNTCPGFNLKCPPDPRVTITRQP